MVVLSHRCIPLTSNLRRLEGAETPCSGLPESDQFDLISEILQESIKNGTPAKEIHSWDYDYESLWSPKLKDSRGRRINLWRCSKDTFIGLLRTRTYWYKRLPFSSRQRLKKLAGDQNGRRRIKDYLDTSDGVLISILFSFPEMFNREGYALSDRIINSVICQCLHNYDRFQKKLKQLRKTIRHHALIKEDIPIDYNYLRDMSYFVRPLQILNLYSKRSSKEKMFRVAMISQTRATGLAGSKLMAESVEEFLQSVTRPKEFNPNPLLKRCIDAVTDKLANEVYLGTNPEFKISMSTSACRESSKRKEGKFGYLKQLVRDAEIKIPHLSEGKSGTLGKWLWYSAVEELHSNRDKVLSVNVTAIRENGKARVVTSGSFWKDVALQPFSHITLHLAKRFPNLKTGLKASRLGWRFIEKIKHSGGKEDTDWIFRSKCYLYTTDWAKATDGPSPEQAWAITGSLLKKTGLDDLSLEVIKDYWLGPKRLYYKGNFVGILRSGIPMGDPLTKTNLSLAHPICDLYAKLKTSALAIEEGNGDDTVAITDDPAYAAAHSEAATMLGYEYSPLDDVCTSDWGVYAEEYFHIPLSPVNTCEWGTRFKDSRLLPYLDTPKIRIMIATQKDRIDFSSDPRGKTTLMGHDQEYFNRLDPGPANAIYSIASAVQDISLATIDYQVPLFLPRQVNGVGKPPPFWSVVSWKNIIQRCSKWHAKYYLTVMKELNEGTTGLSNYRGALKEQNHFDREMLVELYEIPKDDPIRRYIVVQSGDWEKFPEGVLLKLITLGYLIPESKLAKYYLFQERLEQLEQDTKRDLFEVVKAKIIEYPDITDPVEQECIIKEFVENFRDQPYRLRIGREENLYVTKSIEKLENGNPLVVPHTYPLIRKFCKRERPDTAYEKAGLELYQWFMGAVVAMNKEHDYEPPPQDILEDDPIIIQTIDDGGADIFIIATDDVRLFRLARNKFPSTPVFRISCIHYLQLNTWCAENELSFDEEMERAWFQEYGHAELTVATLVDQGSVESYTHKYHSPEEGIYWQTIGIPWRKSIRPQNFERKPRTGFITTPRSASFKDLRMPRQIYDEATHRRLIRIFKSARIN